MYKKLLEGHISFGGIQDALEAVSRLREIKNGVLQIISQDCSGLIGIFCGRFITGAVLTLSGETGHRALRRLLASKEGKFTFSDAGEEVLPDLKQSLGVDIELLLASGLRADALPSEEALSGLMVSGDNIQAINTDAVIAPEKEEDRLHRIHRTYDRLLSLSQQQALASHRLEEQASADVGPPTSSGLDEVIAQRRVKAELPPVQLALPPPQEKPRAERLPAEKPPIPAWDVPWEPATAPVEPVRTAEFKRIKKWDQQSGFYRALSAMLFFLAVACLLFYMWPHITTFFVSHFK